MSGLASVARGDLNGKPGEFATMSDGARWFHPYDGGAPVCLRVAPAMASAESEEALKARLQAVGWKLCHTGGGCWALLKERPDGLQAALTDTSGTALPDGGDWMMALFSGDEWNPESTLWQAASRAGVSLPCLPDNVFPTIDAALEALAAEMGAR